MDRWCRVCCALSSPRRLVFPDPRRDEKLLIAQLAKRLAQHPDVVLEQRYIMCSLSKVNSVQRFPTRRSFLYSGAIAGVAACSGPGNNDATSPETPSGAARSSAASATPTPTPKLAPTPSPQVTGHAVDYRLPPITNGLVPVVTRVDTANPVVFLTIDDGVTKRPEAIRALEAYGYPVTMFLTKNTIQGDPGYFTKLEQLGNRIQNHTVSHDTQMWAKPYAYQFAEINGMQKYAQATYGRTPVLFRPPGGVYSTVMRKAAADAGIRALIDWQTESLAGHMRYQVGSMLRPGDITLMHFRPEFEGDLDAFHQAVQAAQLTVARLEDYLGV